MNRAIPKQAEPVPPLQVLERVPGLSALGECQLQIPSAYSCVDLASRGVTMREKAFGGMSLFSVSPEKESQLAQRMAALGVREADLEESFVRSGGHGGQNVNKVATCVVLLHRPTGLQVKCQATRQQGLNRFLARRLLLDKIEEKQTGVVAAQRAEIEKIRRQKRRRSRRARNKMLDDKSRHAGKKAARRSVAPD